jgi:hypothetical protein
MHVGGLTLAWALRAAIPQATGDFPMTDFLRRTIQLPPAQMSALEAGEVVTKQLPADEKADVAVFGAVRITASPETYAARFRDIVTFRRSPSVFEIGRFSETPQVSDVASLTLEKEDFAAAKNCRPGKCDLKLARSAIGLMHSQIDWSAPDASDRAAAVLRTVMVDFVVAYRKGGATALATYLDKEHPVDASSEFKNLLESTRYLIDYAPSFHAYLASYPNTRSARNPQSPCITSLFGAIRAGRCSFRRSRSTPATSCAWDSTSWPWFLPRNQPEASTCSTCTARGSTLPGASSAT